MQRLIERLKTWAITSSLGRAVFKTVRPLILLERRLASPNLPPDRKVTRVAYGDRKFAFVQRRWSASDAWAIRQCFGDLQYELPRGFHADYVQSVYRAIVAAGRKPLIVDCGANIGASAVWFSARYPEAHIIAVEPAPDNCELLRTNCSGLNVTVRQVALAAEDGQAYLSDPKEGLQMAYRLGENGSGPQVEVVSLRTLLAELPVPGCVPFLLKVDIEGAEEGLFTGDTTLNAQFPLIVIEPHDWLLPGQLTLNKFLEFHIASGRDFCMKDENIISVDLKAGLAGKALSL